jgi:hypothetical protein
MSARARRLTPLERSDSRTYARDPLQVASSPGEMIPGDARRHRESTFKRRHGSQALDRVYDNAPGCWGLGQGSPAKLRGWTCDAVIPGGETRVGGKRGRTR